MRLAIVVRVAGSALLAVVLSGCGLLTAGMYGDPFYNDPPYEYPIPSFGPTISYNSGAAEIKLTDGDKKTIELDELVGGTQDFGMTSATWRGQDGWSLTLSSYDFGETPSYPGETTISLQRIFDNQIWVADMTWNPTACRVTLSTLTDKDLAGSASCDYLRWADGQVPPAMSFTSPDYIDGQEPFGAEITFSASARDSQTS